MKQDVPTFTTTRLLLRPLLLEDAPTVEALAGAAEIAATTLMPHPYPAGTTIAWIQGLADVAARGVFYAWAIVKSKDKVLIGVISIVVTREQSRGALSYWLGVPYWNQGYATEAAQRITAFAFTQRGLHRVEGICFPRNIASARVMEKIGLRFEGVLRGYMRKNDAFEDVLIYGVTCDAIKTDN